MRPFTLACAFLCLWAVSPRAVAAPPKPPRYDITDLGALHMPEVTTGYYSGEHQGALSINNRGQVLLNIEGDFRSGHDVLWERGGVTDLSHLGPGGKSSVAAAINDLGQILINAKTDETYAGMPSGKKNPVARAYLYSAGTLMPLKIPFYAVSISGRDLNNRGEIIGDYITSYDGNSGAFDMGGPLFWSASGTPFHLDGIHQFDSSHRFLTTHFINNRGSILYDGSVKTGEVLTELYFSGGSVFGDVDGFNEKGQIVGQWAFPEPHDTQGFPTVFDAFLTESDERKYPSASVGDVQNTETPARFIMMKITDLGLLPGDKESKASALNDKGQIVGWSRNFTSKHYMALRPSKTPRLAFFRRADPPQQKRVKTQVRAFLWQSGQMYDLHSLTRHGGNWELHNATGINERGQIIGNGLWKGQLHAFLLTPH